MTMGPTLIEEVERMSVVMVHPNQRAGFAQYNSYTIDVNRRENWNYYNYRGLGHLVRNCRTRRDIIEKGRRLEYSSNRNNGQRRIEGGNEQNNLNGEGNLIVFD